MYKLIETKKGNLFKKIIIETVSMTGLKVSSVIPTLTTFLSTNPTASLKAIEGIAAAVYGPTPGNCRNFSAVVEMMPFISLTTY
jgi:hypothetical protein